MQTEPTYNYSEFLQLIKECDVTTLLILIELLCEEAGLFLKTEAEYLYANISWAINRFDNFEIIKFKIL